MPHKDPQANRDYMRRFMRDYRCGDPNAPTNKRHGFSDEQKAEMARMYRAKASLREIGELFRCNPQTVRYWLLDLGVTMRTKGFRLPKMTPRSRQSAAKKGALAGAFKHAQTYVQPTLIRLPARLQAQFEEAVAAVRAERGTGWHMANLVGGGR